MSLKYGLNIVFYMKTYAQFNLENDFEFESRDLKFKLRKSTKNLAVCPVSIISSIISTFLLFKSGNEISTALTFPDVEKAEP